MTVEGINVTKGAKKSIEKAGGKIEEIKPKDKVEKKELKNEDIDK